MPPSRTRDAGATNDRLPSVPLVVLDFETTGVRPSFQDRVIEVAVVVLDATGTIVEALSSVINPARDVGPTRIHGLAAADVAQAPSFDAVAGHFLSRLKGAIVIGHNVRFDEGFLRSEVGRMGLVIPEFPTVCTMAWASRAGLASASRRLEDCCAAAGIGLSDAHCALGDATATAKLLRHCLLGSPALRAELWARVPEAEAASAAWPEVRSLQSPVPRALVRRAQQAQVPYLARLVQALPGDSTPDGDAAPYLDVLDRVLADRLVTEDEATTLYELAGSYGLSASSVTRIHAAYLDGLCRTALLDGVLTDAERRDLDYVARLFGFESGEVERSLARLGAMAQSSCDGGRRDLLHAGARGRVDLRGKSVCFTGELTARAGGVLLSRGEAERLAAEAGVVVRPSVTKALDYLVVADPSTQSGKARKARQYGIPILAEPVFWASLGVQVE